MIRVLLSVILGAALAGIAAWILSADDAWSGLVIPCVISLGVLWPIVLVVRGFAGVAGGAPGMTGTPAATAVAQAETEGRLALARVRKIARTGTSINDQPVCDLDLVVVPRYGSPFEVRTRRLVDLVEIPRLQPEQVVVVLTAERGPSPVTIVMDPPDEWAVQAQSDERVRSVRTAPPFTPTPEQQRRTGLRRIPPVLYLVGIVVGAAVALIPAYPTIAALLTGETTLGEVRYASSYEGKAEAQAEAEAAEAAAANMFVGDNAAEAVELLTRRLGASEVTQLSFWSTNLSAVAPSSPGAPTLDSYFVTDGAVERTGAYSIQPALEELRLTLFDASEVDYSIMPSLIAKAKELTGLTEPNPGVTEQWVYLGRQSVDGFDEPQLVFAVPIDGEYYDGRVEFALDGTVVDLYGGAPGSVSSEADLAG